MTDTSSDLRNELIAIYNRLVDIKFENDCEGIEFKEAWQSQRNEALILLFNAIKCMYPTDPDKISWVKEFKAMEKMDVKCNRGIIEPLERRIKIAEELLAEKLAQLK
jgi:hypothetical protein